MCTCTCTHECTVHTLLNFTVDYHQVHRYLEIYPNSRWSRFFFFFPDDFVFLSWLFHTCSWWTASPSKSFLENYGTVHECMYKTKMNHKNEQKHPVKVVAETNYMYTCTIVWYLYTLMRKRHLLQVGQAVCTKHNHCAWINDNRDIYFVQLILCFRLTFLLKTTEIGRSNQHNIRS